MDDPSQSDEKPLVGATGDFDESEATVLSAPSTLQPKDLPAGMTPRELAHTLQGEMLDQFHLQQFVGGGGMGVVFKALDTTLDRVVAVKVVASHSLSTEDLQRRFLVEAQSAARLDHPNIARIYDSGRSRGLPYIVFEYIEGANIRDLVINHGSLPLGDALSYTYQIAHAMIHASQRDVIHRDIKPSNILVTREGQAKLVDMGLARFYQVGAPEEELTTTGVTLGTFDYISPEQARDPRAADSRSDIYSLGCTLFFMLAGRTPFSQGTPAQKLLQHQDNKPPDILKLRSDLPAPVGKLVERMLEKQPENRPQSPGELAGMVADLMQAQGLQTPLALAPPSRVSVQKSSQVWRRHLPWALPIAGLLLISGLMYSTGREPNREQPWQPIRTKDHSTDNASALGSSEASANEALPHDSQTSDSDKVSPEAEATEVKTLQDGEEKNLPQAEQSLEPKVESSESSPIVSVKPQSSDKKTTLPGENDVP